MGRKKRVQPTSGEGHGIGEPQPVIPGIDPGTGGETPAPEVPAGGAAESSAPSFVVEAQPAPDTTPEAEAERLQRKRDYGREYRKRKKSGAAAAADDGATMQAAMVLVLIDGLATSQLGAEAAITPEERAMIEAPLARILGRMSPAAQEAIEKYADPVILIIGLGTYGARLVSLAESRAKERRRAERKPAARPEMEPAPEGADPGGVAAILAGSNGADPGPFVSASPDPVIMGAVFSGGMTG